MENYLPVNLRVMVQGWLTFAAVGVVLLIMELVVNIVLPLPPLAIPITLFFTGMALFFSIACFLGGHLLDRLSRR